MDGVPRLLDQMTKEQLAQKIAEKSIKGEESEKAFTPFNVFAVISLIFRWMT